MSSQSNQKNSDNKNKSESIFKILKDYKLGVIGLIVLGIVANGLTLFIPKLISKGIDNFLLNKNVLSGLILEFILVIIGIFIFTLSQSILQTIISEKVGFNIRRQLISKIAMQDFIFLKEVNPSKLLTNLTSDINSLKMFVSQAIVQGISSLVIIIGASILLLSIDWKLGLIVLLMIPFIIFIFIFIFRKAKVLFTKIQGIIDWLNKIISESILGSAIIRVLNVQDLEVKKFKEANQEARDTGVKIVKLFAIMIPAITLIANLATLVILVLGGYFVIDSSLSLGNFTAFLSYVAILIFPIMILGFIGNIIAQASASYSRINEVLNRKDIIENGKVDKEIKGDIELRNISLRYDEEFILKNINLNIKANTKTAIIGPTAAGKTQLLYLFSNLIKPNTGEILYDKELIQNYNRNTFHKNVALVFQDSAIFNLSIRENIAFDNSVNEKDLELAIKSAELEDFIQTLPEGIETIISERGNSLSGGQKQRIMLARALAINPKVLLLDDFTARVDQRTEQKILNNIERNYPDLTIISITQKISSVEHYDQIIVLMEGEIVASGTHLELLSFSPEYVQIYNSQKSTNHYEL